MVTTHNTAVTDTASEILGKECRRKKLWVIRDDLDLCDERKDLKKRRYEMNTEKAKKKGSEGPEDCERGLERYPVQAQKEIISQID